MRFAAGTATGVLLSILTRYTWRALLGWALSRGD